MVEQVVEVDHALGTGATSVVTGALPANALVLGVSARVVSAIGGVVSMDLGVSGEVDRFGSGLSPAAGSAIAEIRADASVYPGGADLILSANGGGFDGSGVVRLAVHSLSLKSPRA